MPTIEIKQETLDFLQALVREINGQDNRCAASPYYYAVQVKQEFLSSEHEEEMEVYIDDAVFLTEKAADAYILRNSHNMNCPRKYIKHFRGEKLEMEKLFRAIEDVAGVKLEWH